MKTIDILKRLKEFDKDNNYISYSYIELDPCGDKIRIVVKYIPNLISPRDVFHHTVRIDADTDNALFSEFLDKALKICNIAYEKHLESLRSSLKTTPTF